MDQVLPSAMIQIVVEDNTAIVHFPFYIFHSKNKANQPRGPFIDDPGQGSPELGPHILRQLNHFRIQPFLNQFIDRLSEYVGLPLTEWW